MAKLLLKFNAAVIKEFPVDKEEIKIGRKPDNDVVIDNPAVSGHHAKITRQGNVYVLEDLGSTNGTYMRDRKITKVNLHHQDEVGVAKHTLVFINEEEAAASRDGAPQSSDATVVLTPSATPQPPIAAARLGGYKRPGELVGGLRVVMGETTASEFSLAGLTTYIGKADQANIKLKGMFAPDLAACVARQPDGYYIKVIKGSVKVNDEPVTDQTLLKERDVIDVGNLKLVFFYQDANGPLSG